MGLSCDAGPLIQTTDNHVVWTLVHTGSQLVWTEVHATTV